MTQPLHLSDQAWQDAETLVHRLESLSRTLAPPEAFFEDLVSGLRFACDATVTSVSVVEPDQTIELARSGIAVHTGPADAPHSSRRSRVTTNTVIHPQVEMQLEIQYDQSVSIATEEHLHDLSEVLLTLAAGVYLRQQFAQLRRGLDSQADRDRFLGDLNGGATLEQSFFAIASAIASRSSADRVSLLRIHRGQAKLIATSTQPHVDHRATVALSLQTLTLNACGMNEFQWSFDEDPPADTAIREALEQHIHDSGCRRICLRNVCDDSDQPVAAVIVEWIRPERDLPVSQETPWQSIRGPVEDAIRRALQRDQVGWEWIASRFAVHRRKIGLGIALTMFLLILLTLIPTTLRVPAEGRVIASQRARLFAPRDGVVADVLVGSQQAVDSDQLLIRIESPDLEKSKTEIEGRLATLRTQLDTRLATRSSSRGQSSERENMSVSADERVLRVEMNGLEKQLALIQQQEEALLITSPISGEIDAWDLEQSLVGRPVVRGQHLLDVIAPDGSYRVELELADQLSGYLINDSGESEHGESEHGESEHGESEHGESEHGESEHSVSFRLRSDPTVTYRGVIRQVAASAQPNARGESVIRLTVHLVDSPTQPLRHGATVIAQIDGPQRPLGFVWLRRFIEWSRESIWL